MISPDGFLAVGGLRDKVSNFEQMVDIGFAGRSLPTLANMPLRREIGCT